MEGLSRFKLGMRILSFLVAITFFFQVTGLPYVLAEEGGGDTGGASFDSVYGVDSSGWWGEGGDEGGYDEGYWGDGADTGEGGYSSGGDFGEADGGYYSGGGSDVIDAEMGWDFTSGYGGDEGDYSDDDYFWSDEDGYDVGYWGDGTDTGGSYWDDPNYLNDLNAGSSLYFGSPTLTHTLDLGDRQVTLDPNNPEDARALDYYMHEAPAVTAAQPAAPEAGPISSIVEETVEPTQSTPSAFIYTQVWQELDLKDEKGQFGIPGREIHLDSRNEEDARAIDYYTREANPTTLEVDNADEFFALTGETIEPTLGEQDTEYTPDLSAFSYANTDDAEGKRILDYYTYERDASAPAVAPAETDDLESPDWDLGVDVEEPADWDLGVDINTTEPAAAQSDILYDDQFLEVGDAEDFPTAPAETDDLESPDWDLGVDIEEPVDWDLGVDINTTEPAAQRAVPTLDFKPIDDTVERLIRGGKPAVTAAEDLAAMQAPEDVIDHPSKIRDTATEELVRRLTGEGATAVQPAAVQPAAAQPAQPAAVTPYHGFDGKTLFDAYTDETDDFHEYAQEDAREMYNDESSIFHDDMQQLIDEVNADPELRAKAIDEMIHPDERYGEGSRGRAVEYYDQGGRGPWQAAALEKVRPGETDIPHYYVQSPFLNDTSDGRSLVRDDLLRTAAQAALALTLPATLQPPAVEPAAVQPLKASEDILGEEDEYIAMHRDVLGSQAAIDFFDQSLASGIDAAEAYALTQNAIEAGALPPAVQPAALAGDNVLLDIQERDMSYDQKDNAAAWEKRQSEFSGDNWRERAAEIHGKGYQQTLEHESQGETFSEMQIFERDPGEQIQNGRQTTPDYIARETKVRTGDGTVSQYPLSDGNSTPLDGRVAGVSGDYVWVRYKFGDEWTEPYSTSVKEVNGILNLNQPNTANSLGWRSGPQVSRAAASKQPEPTSTALEEGGDADWFVDDWGFDNLGGFVDRKTGDYYDASSGEYMGNLRELGVDIEKPVVKPAAAQPAATAPVGQALPDAIEELINIESGFPRDYRPESEQPTAVQLPATVQPAAVQPAAIQPAQPAGEVPVGQIPPVSMPAITPAGRDWGFGGPWVAPQPAATAPVEGRPAAGAPVEPVQPNPTAERLRQQWDQPVGQPGAGAPVIPEGARGISPGPQPEAVRVTLQPPAGNEDLMRSLREAPGLDGMPRQPLPAGEMPPLLRPGGEGQPLQYPGGVAPGAGEPIRMGAAGAGTAESRFGPRRELHPAIEAQHQYDITARRYAAGKHAEAAQSYTQPSGYGYGGYGYGGYGGYRGPQYGQYGGYAGPQYNRRELGRAVQAIRGIGESEAEHLRRQYPYQPSESTQRDQAAGVLVDKFWNSLPVQGSRGLIDATTAESLNHLRSGADDPEMRPRIEGKLRSKLRTGGFGESESDKVVNQLLGPPSEPSVSSEPPSSDFYVDRQTGLQGPAYLPDSMKIPVEPSTRPSSEPLGVDATRNLLAETVFSGQSERVQRAITGAEREQQKKNLWQNEDLIIQDLKDKYGNRWTDAGIDRARELAVSDPALAARLGRKIDVEIAGERFSPTPERYNYSPQIARDLYGPPAGQGQVPTGAGAVSPATSAAATHLPLREASSYDLHEANVRHQTRLMMDELAGAKPGLRPTYSSFEKFKAGIDDLLSNKDSRVGMRDVSLTSRVARDEAEKYAEVIRQRDMEKPIWGRRETSLYPQVVSERERKAHDNFLDAVGKTDPKARLGSPIAADVMEELSKDKKMQPYIPDIQAVLREMGQEVSIRGREAIRADEERRTEERRTAESLRYQQDLERRMSEIKEGVRNTTSSTVNPSASSVASTRGAFGGSSVADNDAVGTTVVTPMFNTALPTPPPGATVIPGPPGPGRPEVRVDYPHGRDANARITTHDPNLGVSYLGVPEGVNVDYPYGSQGGVRFGWYEPKLGGWTTGYSASDENNPMRRAARIEAERRLKRQQESIPQERNIPQERIAALN